LLFFDGKIASRHWLFERAAGAGRLLVILAAASAMMTSLLHAQPNENVPAQEPDATASKKPDPENGRRVARALCTNCHLIGEQPGASVNPDVPSFAAIANQPGQSSDRISNWLLNAHGQMPNAHLTRKELADIAAYIMAQRKHEK